MSGAALRLEGLAAAYGQSRVLDGIDLSLPSGGAMALVGRNGVGKSTLLGTIMGVRTQVGGRVLLDGRDMTGLSPDARALAGIALVPQGRQIFPHLSVMENLETGLAALGRRGRRAKLPAMLFDLFPKLRQVAGRKGGFLSGGEQQQLAIARALAGSPGLLLLDEPSEGVQPNVVDEIERALTLARAEMGLTILVVEQNLGFVWRLASHYAAMDGGHIVQAGATSGTAVEDVARLVRI